VAVVVEEDSPRQEEVLCQDEGNLRRVEEDMLQDEEVLDQIEEDLNLIYQTTSSSAPTQLMLLEMHASVCHDNKDPHEAIRPCL